MAELSSRPTVLPPLFEEIPEALRVLPRWVGWRYELNEDRWAKVPIDVKSGRRAATNRPQTWATFEEACATFEKWKGMGPVALAGLGIMLGDGLAGVDLDKVRDPATGEIQAVALGRACRLRSYTDVSPSGTGLHVLLMGRLPRGRKRDSAAGVEMYDGKRWFSVTGRRLEDTPATVETRQAELEDLHAEVFPPPATERGEDHCSIAADERRASSATDLNLSDQELIEKAKRARNGDKFRKLWEGDTSEYPSASEADGGLVCKLAFWAGPDPARIERLFGLSKLAERGKWLEREDYRKQTIESALATITTFYSGRPSEIAASKGKEVVVFGLGDMLDARTANTWRAIQAFNHPPFLFRHGGAIARIELDEEGAPFIRPCPWERLRHPLAERIAFFEIKIVKEDGEDVEKEVPVDPNRNLLENLLATPQPPLPVLVGVVEAPTFARDGSLQTTPGYCPATGTYFNCPSWFRIPDVPERPAKSDTEEALRLLREEVLGDFPFASEAESSHALSMLLLPFCRDLIQGPTPLYLIEKPTPGTGATLLAELVGILATGRPLPSMTEGRDEDEWRKRLFAKLRRGPVAVLIDNLRRRLDSAAFSSAMTAWPSWEDRVLGVSETVRVPVRAMWIATGNNPAVSNEISRRSIRIRLDAGLDQPWLRTRFQHPDLRAWVVRERGRLIWAACTLIRAWLAAGRPAPKGRPDDRGERTPPRLGMFEEWAETMGGILEIVGVQGFLENLQEFYTASDAEGSAWKAFLSVWWGRYGSQKVKAADLFEVAGQGDIDLGQGGDQSQKVRLGKLLGRMKDRVFSLQVEDTPPFRVRLERAANLVHNTVLWNLTPEKLWGMVGVDGGFRPTRVRARENPSSSSSSSGTIGNPHHIPSPPPSDRCPLCDRHLFLVAGKPAPCACAGERMAP